MIDGRGIVVLVGGLEVSRGHPMVLSEWVKAKLRVLRLWREQCAGRRK